jgi:hypothetical protein
MSYNWVPIFGEFDVSGSIITFKGKAIEPAVPTTPSPAPDEETAPTAQPAPAIGTLLSDQMLSNGVMTADVKFAARAIDSACELVLNYDVETRGFISAGITGYNWTLYAVREWVPANPAAALTSEPRWIPYAIAGDRRNLKDDVWYHIEVRVFGSRVTLHIDGVHVATANLPRALNPPRQVGIWCGAFAEIQIRDFRVDTERPKAFVVMQFSSPYNEVYAEVIRDVCAKINVTTLRADEIYGPGLIIGDVTEKIVESQVIIADITPANANVYFEVGYALALNKPIFFWPRKAPSFPSMYPGFVFSSTKTASVASQSSRRVFPITSPRYLERQGAN